MTKLLGVLFLGVVAPTYAKDTTPALAIAIELYDPGLLSEEGLRAVEQRDNVPQGLTP